MGACLHATRERGLDDGRDSECVPVRPVVARQVGRGGGLPRDDQLLKLLVVRILQRQPHLPKDTDAQGHGLQSGGSGGCPRPRIAIRRIGRVPKATDCNQADRAGSELERPGGGPEAARRIGARGGLTRSQPERTWRVLGRQTV